MDEIYCMPLAFAPFKNWSYEKQRFYFPMIFEEGKELKTKEEKGIFSKILYDRVENVMKLMKENVIE